ncbi:Hypothetical protein PMT_2546 [Prochlorococcus marinus str. MIT 9313]|uniref:Uncharacterized protein n=1 Tax=Prochlorococcus marinus (strain MIT 9313) TaxID=74547 RepID=B9ERL0_PROMM|nr:hypothetical protein [Prochlorococcus marinus]CAX32065.1 Hypothetical protein PMT_2546 [Prochlorococcus marinus str. MIT 9313]
MRWQIYWYDLIFTSIKASEHSLTGDIGLGSGLWVAQRVLLEWSFFSAVVYCLSGLNCNHCEVV